jgi:nicotinamide phosphoribosyltransferase
MQSLRLNPILNTDSYKLTHWWQYPPDTRHIYSYVESRGGMFDETMLAMLQYIVKSNFAGQVFTLDDVEQARRLAHAHFSGHPKSFNYEGFRSLFAKHGGRLPLRIRAIKEGTVVKSHNALITIENTDPEFYWLTNWAETVLLQVWYPITVATLSRAIKQVIGKALVRTGDPSLLPFKLHDFGFRGVSSKESAAIGGAAHLINFPASQPVLFRRSFRHRSRQLRRLQYSRVRALHHHRLGRSQRVASLRQHARKLS